MKRATLSGISLSRNLFIIFVFMFFGLLLATVIVAVVGQAVGATSTKGMQLMATIVQNVVAFIAPAVAVMAVFGQEPLHSLRADKAPSWGVAAIVVAMYFVSLPAMNWIIDWNSRWPLPQALLQMEAQAKVVTDTLLTGNSLAMTVVMVLVVGVLTAVGEEMMFRGALLGTSLDHKPQHAHVAVWTVAAVFSAFHMQFLGFVPRMLLGLWLGYLLLRTRSLWVPVIAHALNNGMVVIVAYLGEHGVLAPGAFDKVGVESSGNVPWLALLSAVATASVFVLMWRITAKHRA